MRTIDTLRQLQDIDSQLESARSLLPQVKEQIGNRRELDARAAEVKAVHARLHALETQQRDLDLQADERRAKIQDDAGKLYGGRVTNPKELQSLQEEVAQDKRQLNTIDDQLLEILEKSETLIA